MAAIVKLSQVSADRLIQELRSSPEELKAATVLLRRDLRRFLTDHFKLSSAWGECLRKLPKAETQIVGGAIAEAIESGGKVTLNTDPKLKTGAVRLEFRSRPRRGPRSLIGEAEKLQRKANVRVYVSGAK